MERGRVVTDGPFEPLRILQSQKVITKTAIVAACGKKDNRTPPTPPPKKNKKKKKIYNFFFFGELHSMNKDANNTPSQKYRVV